MLNTTVTSMLPSPERMSTTLAALVLSSPVVGSSRNMIPGLVSSSVAMLTRRFSPPLSPRVNWSPMNECAIRSIPRSSIVCQITALSWASGTSPGSRSAPWNNRCSHTVEVPGSTSSWGTYPLTPRISLDVISLPLTRSSPLILCPTEGRPANTSSSVVLPAPEGPRIAKRSARCRERLPTLDSERPRGVAGPGIAGSGTMPATGPATPDTPCKMRRPPREGARSMVIASHDSTSTGDAMATPGEGCSRTTSEDDLRSKRSAAGDSATNSRPSRTLRSSSMSWSTPMSSISSEPSSSPRLA
mmetsp:Transcript_25122/g.62873  ORF Transcript_25122/g.62873 Transcript_25122/m.62873 type:complete len:301 (-) Transcript_25122:2148-3050(-)